VNGRPVASWEEVTRWIHAETSAVELVVDRTGERMAFAVVPRVKEAKNLLGARVRIGMVGITPSDEVEIRRYSPPRAFVKSAERVVFLTQMTVQAIGRMLTRELSVKESVTGPIGIFYITSSVAQQGFVSLLQLVAVLSTSLGFFNLLPVPVLDGGHLFFLCLERLKGKPVSTRAQEMMTRLGVGLLVFLLVVVTYNDLVKFKIVEKFLPR
ncbi:MAG: RIP metalloprotease RseP, partial [Candidatus Omnitrophica bacterium]|nr:RIP metalloprotease RseP [Candidatus Omnitrophota bacterium]